MTQTTSTRAFDVIFDNGGGITVQTNGFVHYYDNPAQAAHDVRGLMAPYCNLSDWDGDEPESRMEYDYETERNGGYNWRTRSDIEQAIASKEPISVSGYAEQAFLVALTGRTVER
jgi:hypothetical protein